jgi:Leucine-rich repeat (LRR) protein
MKQYCFLFIFIIFFLHTGCVKKTSTPTEAEIQKVSDNAEEKAETDAHTAPDNDAEEEQEYVIIGGKQYKRGWDTEGVYLWVDPEDPESCNSLENIERHWNLKELIIKGKNLDKVDFSPISLLTKLEELEIEGNITRMPDMTNLKQLRKVEIWGALKSLEGINGPSIERLIIGERSPGSSENTMLKVSNMKNLVNLKFFWVYRGKIDLGGIDRFTSLEYLALSDCQPYNISSIGNIKNLKSLRINLISEKPSVEFLKNMPNLTFVLFYGNHQLHRYSYDEFNPTQVLDVTPLATLKNLKEITCRNLIIKNISALDTLEFHNYIDLYGSKLYNEKEKSKHDLVFVRGDR